MRYLLILIMLLTACGADDSAQPAPQPTATPQAQPPLCDPDHYTEPCRGILDEPANIDGTPYVHHN